MAEQTIAASEIDPRFAALVAQRIGREEITPCFTCGACTGVCPVREVAEDFDPRLIIHWIVLGLKDKVLASDLIWLCCLCDSCYHVCPQQIRFRRVAQELQHMAVEQGYVDQDFVRELDRIKPFLNDLCRRSLFYKTREGAQNTHPMPCWRKHTKVKTHD